MSSDLDDYAERPHELTLPDAAILAIRIFALYLAYFFVSALIQFIMSSYWLVESGTWQKQDINVVFAAMNLLLLCIWGIAAVLFWWLAPRFARFMLPQRPETGSLSFSGRYLQSIALSIVGALLAAWSIPPLVQTLSFVYRSGGVQGNEVQLIARLAALAAGIALFLGAKGMAHHWHRIRGQGDALSGSSPGEDQEA